MYFLLYVSSSRDIESQKKLLLSLTTLIFQVEKVSNFRTYITVDELTTEGYNSITFLLAFNNNKYLIKKYQ